MTNTLKRAAVAEFAADFPACLIIDELPVGVILLAGGALVAANGEWASMTGLSLEDSLGFGWMNAIHPTERSLAIRLSSHPSPDGFTCADVRLAVRDEVWVRMHCRNGIGPDKKLDVATFTRLDHHVSESPTVKMKHLATHDGLTGLLNKVGLLEEIRLNDRPDSVAALLFVDLDHFKQVNDLYGHRFGDQVLQATSRRIYRAVRSSDSVGRLGGDEFGIFCGALETPEEAHHLAERVRAVVDKPLSVQGIAVTTGASIGIAFMRSPRQPIEDDIDQADQAMYDAKSRGGNQWVVYSPATSGRQV